MKIPAERWLDAIYQRHSRRQFNGKQLSGETIHHLENFTHELNKHLPGARVAFISADPDPVFKGLIGGYGRIKGAPAYAAFLGLMSDPHVQEKVGYLGECFILEATASGLATCWIGGTFRPEMVTTHLKIEKEEAVLAVTPVGYVPGNYSFTEKTLSGMARSRKRKPLEELLVTGSGCHFPEWIKVSVEAARVAPSAVNRQPWRFVVEDQGITVRVDNLKNSSGISKRLDCGIAMLHIEIGALVSGVKGQWNFLESPDVARYNILTE
ncbi:MAG: nitroreductase [Peptococcaceae bacterium]|nr:nitroreductase [Peptococcaceae bacterium]